MKPLLAALALALAACTPTNPEQWMERELNSCLPTAVSFRQGLKRQDIWAEVFSYRWRDSLENKLHGHAMCAFLYPPGENRLYTYDNAGSWRVRAYTNDISAIAREANAVRGWGTNTYSAEWIR